MHSLRSLMNTPEMQRKYHRHSEGRGIPFTGSYKMEEIHELIHVAARKPNVSHVLCMFLNFPRSFSISLKLT